MASCKRANCMEQKAKFSERVSRMCGISETHLKDSGHIDRLDHGVLISANKTSSTGVLLIKKLTKYIFE